MMENQFVNSLSIAQRVSLITENINRACEAAGRNAEQVQLMAVTKTVDPILVNEAISAGIDLLGENRAQELLEKYDAYNLKNAEIHFIGALQSNKVRLIIDRVSMIQSLDSISLAGEINRQSEKRNKKIDCLVEVNIGDEQSKSGIKITELERFLEEISSFKQIQVCGLMSIPPFDVTEIEKEQNFSALYKLFVDIKGKKIDNIHMNILSMGMSDDYLLAVKHGSTLVRVGTLLFGHRSYAAQTR